MIPVLQIIVVVFVLFAISRAFLRLRDRQIGVAAFLFWNCIWAAVLVVTFIPQITTAIAGFFGIGRGVDIVVYLSIILLLYLIFRLYVKLDYTDQELTRLVRLITIAEAKAAKKEQPSKRRKR